VAAAAGSIWTTQESCATPDVDQDANSYMVYEHVYVRGKNFDANTQFDWSITDLPSTVVASGQVTSDGDGYFCFDAWVVPPSAEGEEHQVDVGGKKDNFGVDGTAPTATPAGSVGEETDSPSLPPTDMVNGANGSADGLGLVLMALAGILATVMVVTPARARRR
jgi:hypothetical protein